MTGSRFRNVYPRSYPSGVRYMAAVDTQYLGLFDVEEDAATTVAEYRGLDSIDELRKATETPETRATTATLADQDVGQWRYLRLCGNSVQARVNGKSLGIFADTKSALDAVVQLVGGRRNDLKKSKVDSSPDWIAFRHCRKPFGSPSVHGKGLSRSSARGGAQSFGTMAKTFGEPILQAERTDAHGVMERFKIMWEVYANEVPGDVESLRRVRQKHPTLVRACPVLYVLLVRGKDGS